MAKNNVYQYDATANNNTDVGSVDVDEACAPSGINNSIRQVMAHLKDFQRDIGAANVSGGAADVQTLTTDSVITAYEDGLPFAFIAGFANTGAATLNVDSVGAKAIRKNGDVALTAGDIAAGQACLVMYDASANSAAGAWMLLNPVTGGLVADTSPQLGGFLDPNGNYIGWDKGGDIASASPLVIDTDGNYFDVTGTTGFAAMTVAANRLFMLQFDGVLTMTHHATNLDLPGEANITTAAGDVGIFFSTGTNTVQCLVYTRADGKPVIGSTQGKHLIPLPYNVWTAPTTNGAGDYADERTNGMVFGWSFDQSTEEYIDFHFAAPKSSDETSGFSYATRWTTASASNDVIWGVKMAVVSNDDPVDPAWGTGVEVTDTVTAANDHMVSAESATVTPGGSWAEGDTIKVRVYRKAAAAGDTHAADAIFEHLDLFITTNADTDA